VPVVFVYGSIYMLLLLYLYEYVMASTTSVANSSQKKVLNICTRSYSNNNENRKRMRRMYIVIIKLQNCPFCALPAIVISLTFFTHITILYYSHVFMSCPFCLFISLHVFFSPSTNTRTHVLFSGGHRNFINATCGFFFFFFLPILLMYMSQKNKS